MTKVVTQSSEADCGVIQLEFFNDDETHSPLDESIFLDDRTQSPNNEFTVLKASDTELKPGTYSILYKVYLVDYRDIEVV